MIGNLDTTLPELPPDVLLLARTRQKTQNRTRILVIGREAARPGTRPFVSTTSSRRMGFGACPQSAAKRNAVQQVAQDTVEGARAGLLDGLLMLEASDLPAELRLTPSVWLERFQQRVPIKETP